MIRYAAIMFGIMLTTMSYSAELLQSDSGYNSQLRAENCINNYCVLESVISEETNCEDICRQCAKEAEQEYNQSSEICQKINL